MRRGIILHGTPALILLTVLGFVTFTTKDLRVQERAGAAFFFGLIMTGFSWATSKKDPSDQPPSPPSP